MGQFSSYKPGRNGHEYASRKGTTVLAFSSFSLAVEKKQRASGFELTTVLAFSSFSLASPGGPFYAASSRQRASGFELDLRCHLPTASFSPPAGQCCA
eukprot:CAMPEP_0167808704 /NCGR_PEP_ID=MMETSP0111_2-20121227/23356_1 /TAXON_ID=91324 /ORGANISM="Lotharella globosa, Strain CCCM811" /LENGTH=97 /DNA_ID=CAMNT_0007706947 /DNA_START=752 /DNA_END=1046 /DNA_ORIENTATION=-